MATAGRMSGTVPELVACVVGLSRAEGENFTEQEGIGKSCLCCRFMHPSFEDYTEQHQSLLALHEFTNPVINNVHFLYWGSTERSFPTKMAEKSVSLKFHVIEQTVFYQDETSKPFSSGAKPDSVEQYIKRITGLIECPGKLSYTSWNDIETDIDQKQQYPARLSRLPRAFMVVVDVSLKGTKFSNQLSRVEKILEHLMKLKQKYVLVATKRDDSCVESLEQVHKMKRKYRTLLVETSASQNVNIVDAFRLAAWKTLQKKAQGISDTVPDYEDPSLSMSNQPKSPSHSKRHSMPLLTTLRITDSRGRHHYSLVGSDDEEEMLSLDVETVTETAVEESDVCNVNKNFVSFHENTEGESERDGGREIVEGEREKMTHDQRLDLKLNSPDLIDSSRHHLKLQQHDKHQGNKSTKSLKSSKTTTVDSKLQQTSAESSIGKSTSHIWRDWHTLKVVKPRTMFGRKSRSSPIEQRPLL